MLQIGVVFAEEYARELLVIHAIVAAALVAVTTHLVVWLWPWLRGSFRRQRGVKRFATLASALYLATFTVGNLLYPVYKTRVRLEFLENSKAIEAQVHSQLSAQSLELTSPIARDRVNTKISEGHSLAAWFDIKEHWVGLALALSLAITFIVRFWSPKEGSKVGLILFGLAVCQCSAVWFAAVVGLFVSAFRSVGA